MSNTFETARYVYGGYGGAISPLSSTGYYVGETSLTTRARGETPIECTEGRLVALPGYKINNAYFLTSTKTETITLSGSSKIVYVDVIVDDPDYRTVDNVKIVPKNAKYVCLSIKKDSGEDFTQSELDNLYGTAFVFLSNEELTKAVYNAAGNVLVNQCKKYVQIDILKTLYPNYTDDQLLERAILIARAYGGDTKILWDGTNIYFSGVIHTCYGFGGIDFNGSKIVMPNYNVYSILLVIPDDAKEVTAQYSEITKDKITNASLLDKIFTLNDNYSGNDDMCLGNRIGYEDDIYYTPTIKTSLDGFIETGKLYLVPASGTVTCYNVHSYPAVTFELCNGVIITNTGEHLSLIVQCLRSNTHFHNFTLRNRSTAKERRRGIAEFKYCYGIEVDHISGINPIQKSISGGYVLALYSVSNLYVHDVSLGDSISWGVIGGNHLTNSVYERCYMNRWDCHYAQYGYNIVRDCYFNFICYGGAGHGMIIIEKCTFMMQPVNSSAPITMRGDLVAVFDGDIIVRDCIFEQGTVTLSDFAIWTDGTTNQKPENSKITEAPRRQRILDNCEIPAGILRVFRIGTSVQSDKLMFSNLTYKIKDCTISCSEGVFVAPGAGQPIKDVILEGCTIDNCLTTKNIVNCNVRVSNCDLVNIDSDATLPRLIANGNTFSGTQSVSNFTAYALAGNIASDMASVNKHS